MKVIKNRIDLDGLRRGMLIRALDNWIHIRKGEIVVILEVGERYGPDGMYHTPGRHLEVLNSRGEIHEMTIRSYNAEIVKR